MDKLLFLNFCFFDALLYIFVKYFAQLSHHSTIEILTYANIASVICLSPFAIYNWQRTKAGFVPNLRLFIAAPSSALKTVAVGYLPIKNVAIISYLAPGAVVFLSFIMLGEYEKGKNKKFIWLAVSFVGVMIFVGIHDIRGNPFMYSLVFLHVLFKGDRSNKWAKDVQREFANLKIPTPQLIIGFYTPRVPLTLAEYYAKQFNIPWFADLQDDLIDGIARNMHGFSLSWAKRVLKSAKTVIQVSPEWAKAEAEGLGRNVVCIRHVVPAPDNALKSVRENPPPLNNTFTIFYGGSINFNYQRLDILNQVSKQLPPDKKVVLSFAGTEAMYKKMEQHLEGNITLQNAGWLDAESYHRQVLSAHCCLVLPWALPPRQVIPSKFYEFCQYDKPIWIVGNDTGSFSSLFNEWQHPKIPTGDASYQLQTLLNALNGDYSGMFLPSRCQNAPLTEARLYEAYTKYL
ncbi:MAG: hypothetical protein EBX41_09755 [Chitinophagia bacterium]|nr:hypothetical protein [Chitinophagia bacterium]